MLAQALLDSCSQSVLPDQGRILQQNALTRVAITSVQGIGSSITTSKKLVSAEVLMKDIQSFSQEMHFNVLPWLTVSLPTASCDTSGWNLSEAVFLSGPCFHKLEPVDTIIGAEIYMDQLLYE